MPIEFESGGYIYWEDAMGTPSLGIESDHVAECLAELRRRQLKGVFGTVPYFKERDLDFLNEAPEVISVQFYDIKLADLSGLYRLPKLQYLRLSGKRPPLEFGQLAQLRQLVWEHHQKDCGIDTQKSLEWLNLWRFKAANKRDFEMKLPHSLKQLGIFWSNVETVAGFGALPHLNRLEIGRCRNLCQLGDLAETFPSLEILSVSACGRLTADEALRAISGHPRLRHVFADNRLLLSSDDYD